MRISRATIGTTDVEALERFHRDVLRLPVERITDSTIEVRLGASVARYEQREEFAGAHHLAYAIAPEDFEQAHAFLESRVDLLTAGGSTVIDGPQGWTSRSVYFDAPDGLILEYIAHEGHRGLGSSGSGTTAPRPFGIAEVGIGATEVSATVDLLSGHGLPQFPPQEPAFAPVGDVDGMLIVVQHERLWFPELRTHPATDAAIISIAAPGAPRATITLERATLHIN